MGDPVLSVGLQIGTTISDLSEFDNVSFSFKLHRYLARGTTIALGGESLFSNNALADDAGDTYYLVVSHVVQTLGSSRPRHRPRPCECRRGHGALRKKE